MDTCMDGVRTHQHDTCMQHACVMLMCARMHVSCCCVRAHAYLHPRTHATRIHAVHVHASLCILTLSLSVCVCVCVCVCVLCFVYRQVHDLAEALVGDVSFNQYANSQ